MRLFERGETLERCGRVTGAQLAGDWRASVGQGLDESREEEEEERVRGLWVWHCGSRTSVEQTPQHVGENSDREREELGQALRCPQRLQLSLSRKMCREQKPETGRDSKQHSQQTEHYNILYTLLQNGLDRWSDTQ